MEILKLGSTIQANWERSYIINKIHIKWFAFIQLNPLETGNQEHLKESQNIHQLQALGEQSREGISKMWEALSVAFEQWEWEWSEAMRIRLKQMPRDSSADQKPEKGVRNYLLGITIGPRYATVKRLTSYAISFHSQNHRKKLVFFLLVDDYTKASWEVQKFWQTHTALWYFDPVLNLYLSTIPSPKRQ